MKKSELVRSTSSVTARHRRPAARSVRAASWLVGATSLLVSLTDCSQTPTSVPIRSLERSGKMALLCLDPDLTVARSDPNYPLDGCQTNYATKPNGSGLPLNLFAVVNQTTRGEVAVLNLSTGLVIDVDGATPGYNFLPVGQQPVDIVTTPQGTATFVASAEVNRPAIYAMPADRILVGGPTIRDWPACTLPGNPGAMTLAIVPSSAVTEPGGWCPGPNWGFDHRADPGVGDDDQLADTHPRGDLALETAHPGRQKLVVSIPSEGSLLVIDAQHVLDREPGSFGPCPIERRIALRVDLPPSTTVGNEPSGPVCPPLEHSTSLACPTVSAVQVAYSGNFSPQPAQFAFEGATPGTDGQRLFITDLNAPVVHVVDLANACDPVERAPLLPSAYDDPNRPITTSGLGLSGITRDLKQYLYAVDELAGSVMVFDVGKTASTRSPLVRPRPDFFPYSNRDRLSLGAPVRAITFFTQELPYDDGTGNLVSGVACNPTADPTDVAGGGVYQTSGDYTTGAGPRKLRGTFALAALTSGSLEVIDVDDYDAPCRTYQTEAVDGVNTFSPLPSWMTGCYETRELPASAASCATPLLTSAAHTAYEQSCRVVDRHEVRSAYFIGSNATTGPRAPAVTSYAQLTKLGNSVRDDNLADGPTHPRLRGPKAPQMDKWTFDRGGTPITLDPAPVSDAQDGSVQNFVIADIREPRTAVEQDWTLTCNGALPGFDGKVARLAVSNADDANRGIYDPNAYFCANGVHDRDMARLEARRLLGANATDDVVEAYSAELVDEVEITNGILDRDDPYWTTPGLACSYIQCRANFGTPENPQPARSFQITAAYQDHVLTEAWPLTDRAEQQPQIKPECCFPTLVTYRVRGGRGAAYGVDASGVSGQVDPATCTTWIAIGGATGFTHHVISDQQGRCMLGGVVPGTGEICDETVLVRTGRAYEVPDSRRTTAVEHDDPYVFHNPQMYFAVFPGSVGSDRDMSFSWHMGGGFVPLTIGLGRGSPLVSPQSIFYHPALGSGALVTDGALQGVVQVDLYQLIVTNTYF